MNVYQFGIFYVPTEKYVIHSYICIDRLYEKVGNNLVSCMINHFKDMGYFSSLTFGDITICAGICTGKNKKKITI